MKPEIQIFSYDGRDLKEGTRQINRAVKKWRQENPQIGILSIKQSMNLYVDLKNSESGGGFYKEFRYVENKEVSQSLEAKSARA